MKAIFVVDIPDNLIFNELFVDGEIRYTSDLERGFVFLKEIDKYKLKPMPERKLLSQDRGKNRCEYSLLDRLEYQKGFNDCIEEILGKENENH